MSAVARVPAWWRGGAVAALVFALAAIGGCRSAEVAGVRMTLRVEGATLALRIENRAAGEVRFDANLLDRTRPQALTLAVTTERGTPVERCRDIAYPDGEALRVVAAGTTQRVEIPAISVMDAFCLSSDRAYRVRAVLAANPADIASREATSNEIIITLREPPAP